MECCKIRGGFICTQVPATAGPAIDLRYSTATVNSGEAKGRLPTTDNTDSCSIDASSGNS